METKLTTASKTGRTFLRPRMWMAALLLGCVGTAHAQGGYGAIGLGQAQSKDDFTTIGLSIDDKDTAWKIYGGYQFIENAAIEVFYVDLGEFKGTGTFLGSPATDNWEATGFGAMLVGEAPVTKQVGVLGKIGFMRWDVDDRVTLGSTSASASETGTDVAIGLGAVFDINRDLGVRVEWERFADVGDQNITGKTDIDLFSVSLVYMFR